MEAKAWWVCNTAKGLCVRDINNVLPNARTLASLPFIDRLVLDYFECCSCQTLSGSTSLAFTPLTGHPPPTTTTDQPRQTLRDVIQENEITSSEHRTVQHTNPTEVKCVNCVFLFISWPTERSDISDQIRNLTSYWSTESRSTTNEDVKSGVSALPNSASFTLAISKR